MAAPTTGALASLSLGYVRDQVARGWDVTVACPSEGALGYDAREAGARVRWWPAGRTPGPGTIAELSRLARILEETRPDVLHLHGRRAGLGGRLVVRGRVPTVFQPHGGLLGERAEPLHGWAARWERYAARWTGELICLSSAEGDTAEALGVLAPTTVLARGVDVTRFSPQGDHERELARELLGLAEVPTTLCLGRISDKNGQRDLIAAWPDVRSQVPTACLLLVGDPAEHPGLVKAAAQVDGVRVVGARTDVQSWLAAADVVVSPTTAGGTSLVALEAMACGRSIVTTDQAVFGDDPPDDVGAIIPGGDQDALVHALVARLRSPGLVEDEGWNGRSHVELHHDATTSARGLSRVYLRLVSARRAP